MRPAPLLVLDAALVTGFAALGRSSHEEGVSLSGVLTVAAPFLIGTAAGWLVSRAWRAPAAVSTGVVVWAVTVAGGMALRGLAFDRGVAPSFVVVAAVTLGVMLVGWRLALRAGPLRRVLPGR